MTEPNPFDLYVDSRIRMILAVHAQNGADFVPHTMITMQEGELAALRRQVAEHHCVPTQDAYDAACAALNKHRERADALADLVDVVALQLGRTGDMKPQQLHYMVGSIVDRLRRAYERDAAKRAAHPDAVKVGPELACGTCYNAGWINDRDCPSCSIRAARCGSCDHIVDAWHRDGGCHYGISVTEPGSNVVCPCTAENPNAPAAPQSMATSTAIEGVWMAGITCPVCHEPPGTWCRSIGGNPVGWVHDERRDAYMGIERAPRGILDPLWIEIAADHIGQKVTDWPRHVLSAAARAALEQVLPLIVARIVGHRLAATDGGHEPVADVPFRTVEMRAENGVFTRVEVHGEHVAGTGNGMALLSPWAAEVVGKAYLHAAREALENAGGPVVRRGGQPWPPIPAPPAVDGACVCGGLDGTHIFRGCPHASTGSA